MCKQKKKKQLYFQPKHMLSHWDGSFEQQQKQQQQKTTKNLSLNWRIKKYSHKRPLKKAKKLVFKTDYS